MGRFIPAFVKIGAPDLAGDRIQRAEIFVEYLERYEIFNAPFRVRLDFRVHDLRQGMVYCNLTSKLPWHGVMDQFLAWGPLGLAMIKQHCTAAVDFEVQVTAIRLRRHKKFHTTVPADAGLVLGLHAADIFVKNPEKYK